MQDFVNHETDTTSWIWNCGRLQLMEMWWVLRGSIIFAFAALFVESQEKKDFKCFLFHRISPFIFYIWKLFKLIDIASVDIFVLHMAVWWVMSCAAICARHTCKACSCSRPYSYWCHNLALIHPTPFSFPFMLLATTQKPLKNMLASLINTWPGINWGMMHDYRGLWRGIPRALHESIQR